MTASISLLTLVHSIAAHALIHFLGGLLQQPG